MATKPMDGQEQALVKIDVARKALALAVTIPDVKKLRDQAAAVEYYLRRQQYSGEAIADASELKLRAERKLGELLAETVKPGKRSKDIVSRCNNKDLPEDVTQIQSHRWQLVASVPVSDFEQHVVTVREQGDRMTTAGVVRVAKQRARQTRVDTPVGPIPLAADRYRLIESDVAALGTVLEPESVDCIITDPPYPKEFLPVYQGLAQLAAHVLRPGGSCIAMVGQSHLPDVIAALASALTYQWTLAYLTPGQSTQVFGRHIKSCWKPVLWFVKGKYAGEHVDDIVRSDGPSKAFHEWGQSEAGMADLIQKFTYKGQTILDPFVGGGATLVAAVQLERVAIGADIDAAHLQTAARRLAATAA